MSGSRLGKIDFDSVGGPGGDAAAEEVGVFDPDGIVDEQRRSHDRPVIIVAEEETLSRPAFEQTAGLRLNETDETADRVQ